MRSVQRTELQQQLDQLWAAVIDQITFDPLRNRIEIAVHAIDDGETSHAKLVFEDLAAFRFLHNTGEDRKMIGEYEEGDQLELSLVKHFPNGVEGVQADFVPNFVIEMYQQVLHLEARVVIVDGERFEVGFVNN